MSVGGVGAVSAVHADPDRHGVRFGQVTVTVDVALGDCVLHVLDRSATTPVPRRVRLHSIEEMQGYVNALAHRSTAGSTEADLSRAAAFAAAQIQHGGK